MSNSSRCPLCRQAIKTHKDYIPIDWDTTDLCVICYDNPIEITLACGHSCVCKLCLGKLIPPEPIYNSNMINSIPDIPDNRPITLDDIVTDEPIQSPRILTRIDSSIISQINETFSSSPQQIRTLFRSHINVYESSTRSFECCLDNIHMILQSICYMSNDQRRIFFFDNHTFFFDNHPLTLYHSEDTKIIRNENTIKYTRTNNIGLIVCIITLDLTINRLDSYHISYSNI
jgi:hypothetical protein